jgi:hypothetical protein
MDELQTALIDLQNTNTEIRELAFGLGSSYREINK